MLLLSFSRIYFAFFMKALFTLVTSLGRSLAVLDRLEAIEQAKAAVSGKRDSVPLPTALLALQTKPKHSKICPRIPELGCPVSQHSANLLSDYGRIHTKLLPTAPHPQ